MKLIRRISDRIESHVKNVTVIRIQNDSGKDTVIRISPRIDLDKSDGESDK